MLNELINYIDDKLESVSARFIDWSHDLPSGTTRNERLIQAVKAQDLAGVIYHLEKGANPEARGRIGTYSEDSFETTKTIFEKAVDTGNVKILGALMDYSSPFHKYPDAWAAALKSSNPELARKFVLWGADVNEPLFRGTPIVIAAREGNLPVVKLLVEYGAIVENAPHPTVVYSVSPLVAALSYSKDVPTIKFLLDNDIDPNIETDSLVKAVLTKDLPALNQILESGDHGDLNAKGAMKSNPLHFAIMMDFDDGITSLVQHGADTHGMLKSAVHHESSMQTLLDLGCDKESIDEALFAAVSVNQKTAVITLLERGADPMAKPSIADGKTAMDAINEHLSFTRMPKSIAKLNEIKALLVAHIETDKAIQIHDVLDIAPASKPAEAIAIQDVISEKPTAAAVNQAFVEMHQQVLPAIVENHEQHLA